MEQSVGRVRILRYRLNVQFYLYYIQLSYKNRYCHVKVAIFTGKMKPNDSYLYAPTFVPIERRMSHLSVSSRSTETTQGPAEDRLSPKYDSYQEFLYRSQLRRRLSSTGMHGFIIETLH